MATAWRQWNEQMTNDTEHVVNYAMHDECFFLFQAQSSFPDSIASSKLR